MPNLRHTHTPKSPITKITALNLVRKDLHGDNWPPRSTISEFHIFVWCKNAKNMYHVSQHIYLSDKKLLAIILSQMFRDQKLVKVAEESRVILFPGGSKRVAVDHGHGLHNCK